MKEMKELFENWEYYKEVEREAVQSRRHIENEITQILQVPDNFTGNKTKVMEGYELKITARTDLKVDVAAVQELANENGLHPYLDTLFRWKAEVKSRDWERCDPRVTEVLKSAITEKTGRLTYKITQLGE